KHYALRQASLNFMELGKQQYRRDLITDAERSFRRARIFQNYITAAEREQLNELLANARIAISEGKQAVTETKSADESVEPNQPVKAEVMVEKVKEKGKESEPSTEKERKQIKEKPALIIEWREQTEERAKTEAQLQAQTQAYAALEEQLKAEKQARLKAQQEAEAQTKQRAIIEAAYAEAVSAAKARATEKAELHAAAIKKLEQKLESQTEEITRAEAKAESESTARLEAEKIASQEAAARAKLEKQLRVEAELRAIIEAEAEEAIAAAKADAEAKAEAQLQVQAQAYAALEEQLKAETQARLKDQQEAQAQTQERTSAEEKADSEAATRLEAQKNARQEAKARAKVEEQLRAEAEERSRIETEAKEATVEELEQMGGSAVPSLINPNAPKTDPNSPKEKTIDMGNGVIMEFVLIPAGKFEMGSPSTESDRGNNEGPVHWVIISRPFYMGKYEVTQEQYYVVAKYKPSRFKQEGRPVENVSWDQADRFCRKLSEMKGGTYRLPTEAEWEYACRAGSQGIFCFGGGITYSQIEQYAWYSKNSDSATHPVGEKKPNSFGLYDMHGNVWEWCGDWYADNYYNHGVMIDPPGPQNGKSRVLRGGSWLYGARYCRSANRIDLDPYYIRNHVGFRVVLEIE
ncbi:SUMF1/EgtB/PvdO family nonheme iron enzyme, partial [Planctomycetota bacterium]